MLGDLFVLFEVVKQDLSRDKENQDFWRSMAFMFLFVSIVMTIVCYVKGW